MIPFAKPVYYGDEERCVLDAVKSTWISDGPYIDKLIDQFSKVFDTPDILLTSNGTSALQLAFLSLDLKPGDEVIIPGYCFQAAANVALQLGLKPVFADLNYFMELSVKDVERKITSKTRAVVCVYNFGYGYTNILQLKSICEENDLFLIEDCAEALFTRAYNQYVGTFGDVSTFSFHATKTITTGEGGMVVFNDQSAYCAGKLFHSHGLQTRGTYSHILPGNNFRMSNINAALGYAQMLHMNEIIEKKISLANQYSFFLEVSRDNILWSYPAEVDDAEKLVKFMKESGVEIRPGFIPSNKLIYFDRFDTPNCDKLYNKVVMFPMYTSLTEEDMQYILEVYRSFYNGSRS